MAVAALTHVIRMDLSDQSALKSGYLGVPAPGALVDITALVDLDEGITRRWGRDDRFADAPTPGTLTFVVDNSDGRFTPANPLKMFKRGATKGTLVVWEVSNGTTTRRLKYRIESAVAMFPAGTAGSTQVRISCRDALGQMATTEARSALEIDVLSPSYYAVTPQLYWALDEGSEAKAAAESSGNRGPEMVVAGDLNLYPDALGWGSGGGPGGDGKGALIFGKDAPAVIDPGSVRSLEVERRAGGSSVDRGWPYLRPGTPSLPTTDPWTRGFAAFGGPNVNDRAMLAVECWALAQPLVSEESPIPRNRITLWEMTLADGTVLNLAGVYGSTDGIPSFGYFLIARRGADAVFSASTAWVSKNYIGEAASGHLGRTHHIYLEITQTFTVPPIPAIAANASYTTRLYIDGIGVASTTATNRIPARGAARALRPTYFTIGGGMGDLTRQQGTWIGTIGRVAIYNDVRRAGQSMTIRPWLSAAPLPGGLLRRYLIGTDETYQEPAEKIQYLLERAGLPYGSYPNWLPSHNLTATYGVGSYPRAGFDPVAFSADNLSQQDSAGSTWLSMVAEALRQDRATLFCWGGTANGADEPVIARGFDQMHPFHPVLTVDVEDDHIGVPAFIGEVSGRVSSATAKSWRRSASHTDWDLVDQLGNQSASVSAAVDNAGGLGRIAEDRVAAGTSAGLNLSTVSIDRQLAASAATAGVHLLVPGNRITITGIPRAFGVTTVDLYVIGGEETHRVGTELFVFTTEPADAPTEGVFFPEVRNDAAPIRTEDHLSTSVAEFGMWTVAVPDEYGRLSGVDTTLAATINATTTTVQVRRPTASVAWSTDTADYPMTIEVRGEKMRCPNPPTTVTTSPPVQQFTGVTRGHGGTVARAHTAGEDLNVAQPPTFTLGHYLPAWVASAPAAQPVAASSSGTGTAVAQIPTTTATGFGSGAFGASPFGV